MSSKQKEQQRRYKKKPSKDRQRRRRTRIRKRRRRGSEELEERGIGREMGSDIGIMTGGQTETQADARHDYRLVLCFDNLTSYKHMCVKTPR